MADRRIYIGGKIMPKVKALDISREPIWSANTGRNSKGTMIGTLIGHKYKLKITFVPLSDADAALLDSAVAPGFFQVKFWSQKENKQVTATMYAGTQTYPVYSYAEDLPRYVGVGVDLIER